MQQKLVCQHTPHFIPAALVVEPVAPKQVNELCPSRGDDVNEPGPAKLELHKRQLNPYSLAGL